MSTPTQPGTDLTSVLSLEERGFPFETELSLAPLARFWSEIVAQMGSNPGGRSVVSWSSTSAPRPRCCARSRTPKVLHAPLCRGGRSAGGGGGPEVLEYTDVPDPKLSQSSGMGECAAHCEALRSGVRAIDGVDAMLRRVVETAHQPCLGVGSICEFGVSRPGRGGANRAALTDLPDIALKALR